MNPFTLKELRQLTRSRVIAGGLILALFAFLVATYLIPLGGINYQTGQGLAVMVTVLLLPALAIGLPIDIFVKMVRERRVRNADLTLITPLAPSAIIDGKLCGAYALMFLLSAATLPFGVAAYLLHGITFVAMFKMLVFAVSYSCLVVHITLALGCLHCSAVFRVIAFVVVIVVSSFFAIPFGFITLPAVADMPDFTVMILAFATACLLLRAQAIAWISPKVMERDFPLRLTALLASIGWIGYKLIVNWNGSAKVLQDWAGAGAAQFAVLAGWIAACAMAQGVGYSQRQLAALPASRWRRAVTWPFRSGAVNGVAFALALGLLVSLVLPLVTPHINELYRLEHEGLSAVDCVHKVCVTGSSDELHQVSEPWTEMIVFCYVMAVMMYFRAGWYWLCRKTRVSPVLVPVVALLVFGFLQTIPGLMELSYGDSSGFVPFCLSGGKWAEVYPLHRSFSAIALAIGILAMLPEALAAFRSRLTAGVSKKFAAVGILLLAAFAAVPVAQAEVPDFALQNEAFARYYSEITGVQPAAKLVEFAIDPAISKTGNDAYSIVSAGKGVKITGSNVRSVWYGLYDLLERRGGCTWFWDGDRVPKKAAIDLAGLDVHEEARFEYRGMRYFAHRGLTRFQAEHWGIKDWQREIDWLLKSRFNIFMPRIGMDDTWQKAYPDLVPYPDPKAPAEGGLKGFDNRVSFWGLKYRGELRKAFTQYAFARGLQIPTDFGTMTHWYSRTPQAFLDKMKPPFFPIAEKMWSNYSEPSGLVWDIRQPGWLDRYWHLTDTFVKAGYGNLDLLHTIGLGERNCFDDRAKNHQLKIDVMKMLIDKALKEAPDAKILLAGWDFYATWKPEEVRALIPMLDPKNTIIWDYSGEAFTGNDRFQPTMDNDFTQWGVVGKFPYTYGVFLAYESSLDIRANYPMIEAREKVVANDPMCKGYITWPETSHTDTFFLHYLKTNAWKPGHKADDLLPQFCRDRYGEDAAKFAAVWKQVIALSTTCGWGGNWGLDLTKWPKEYWKGRDLAADEAMLEKEVPSVLAELAAITPKDDFQRRDLMDLARTAADRLLIVRRHRLMRDFDAWANGKGDGAAVVREAKAWQRLVSAFTDLLALHTDYSLYDSLERLAAAHTGVVEDFEKVLMDNAIDAYCRSHQYEIAAGWYRPLADAIAAEMTRRISAGERQPLADDWLNSTRDKTQADAVRKGITALRPTIERTDANLQQALRAM